MYKCFTNCSCSSIIGYIRYALFWSHINAPSTYLDLSYNTFIPLNHREQNDGCSHAYHPLHLCIFFRMIHESVLFHVFFPSITHSYIGYSSVLTFISPSETVLSIFFVSSLDGSIREVIEISAAVQAVIL